MTVTDLAGLIRETLERGIRSPLRVRGEVSNLSAQGHWFFSLKDERSVVRCVAWASDARGFGFEPEEGTEVIVEGYVSHYGPQGRTQLYVREMTPVGAGALELKFRRMCDELRRLGYFDEARKRPLPAMPRKIAVITSAGGAAIHDVRDTAARRCPAVGLVLLDTRVQGDGAAARIAQAIRRAEAASARLGIDAILVTRGGGSAEDLWAFNERVVADAAFNCSIPLVAAVGHESDTTVIELVADVRAATPTQAVMRLVPDAAEVRQQLDHLAHRLRFMLRSRFERESRRVDAARLARAVHQLVARRRERYEALGRHLGSVDPHRVLERGYSWTVTAAGDVVTSAADVNPGDEIATTVRDGTFSSVVGRPGAPRQMDLFERAR